MQPQQPSLFMSIVPLVVIFGIFYLLLILPMRRRQKKHQEMLAQLTKGDRVVPTGGIFGTVVSVDGDVLSLIFAFPIIPVIIVFKLVVIFLWLIAAVLGAALFPKPIAYAAGEIRKGFWPVFGTGLVAMLVFSTLVIIATFLSVILIGIPIFLALCAAGFIVMVFGRLAVLYTIGEASLRALGSKRAGAMGTVLFGLLVFSLAGFVPILGFLFGFVMNAVGWGIAVRTKFGTRENWFHKKAPC